VNSVVSRRQALQVQTKDRDMEGIAVGVIEADLDAGSIRAEGESP